MSRSSPHGPRRLGSQTVVVAVLALALFAAACAADDPRTAPTTSQATTSTAPPATTTASAPEPEPEPEAAEAAEPADAASTSASTTVPDPPEAAAGSDQSGELRWSDVLDGLSDPAQFCILESLGEDDLEAVLARPLASDDFPTADDASMLACIGPQPARDVFLSFLVWSIQSELGAVISDEEVVCLRESMADLNVIAMVDPPNVESPDDPPDALALFSVFGKCVGDAFISILAFESGVDFEDLSDDELACMREWQAGVDWDGLAEDPEAANEVDMAWSFGLPECLPERMGFEPAPEAPSIEAPSG